MRKTSARVVAGSLALGLGLQVLTGCATAPKAPSGGTSSGSAPGTSTSSASQPDPTATPSTSPAPAPPGGSSNRPRPRTSTNSVERAALMGFMFGSPFGPIGAGAGTILGFIYGHLARRDAEKKAEADAQRQEAADADLERQIDERNTSGAGRTEAKATPARKQGVIIVKDHLADSPGRPPAGPPADSSGTGGGQPTPQTGVARALPPDADADGFRPIYEGGRLVRRERYAQGNRRPDTVLHYGADGQLVRREESSRLDGRMDMWAHYANGKLVRREADTRGTGLADLWIYYDEGGNVARAEALLEDGRKLTQVFVDGQVAREEWRRHPGGELSAIATHQDGKVVQREEDSTGRGRLDLVSVFDPSGRLVKQGRRADEGWLMSWRYFGPAGGVVREEELRKDGELVTVSIFEDGRLTRKELYELDEDSLKRAPLVPDGTAAAGG